MSKVIITCAVTGSIHTPTMSPHLPLTPDEIAADGVAAADAGASILHLHARNPEDGSPTPDPDVFMAFLPRIKQQTDAVINITTGGGLGMTLDERLAAPRRASPEMTSLNMGSMNFGIYPMLDRYQSFKHDWERAHLEGSRDFIFRNTFKDIEHIMKDLGEGHGIGADHENLMHMRRIANKLFGEDYRWSILAAGKHQMSFVTMGAMMGGNIRVGLEDSLYVAKGKLAKSNAEQVAKVRRIVEDLSLEVATPAEAREMLDLKGGDQVAF